MVKIIKTVTFKCWNTLEVEVFSEKSGIKNHYKVISENTEIIHVSNSIKVSWKAFTDFPWN